ncbi:MAG: SDR family NAD(P)-dependent oxidoreductase [Halorientalis sp.]
MPTLAGEVVVVTGASRGLGRSMAERFSDEGAQVTLTARNEDRLESVASDLDGETLVAPGDVRDSDAVASVVEQTIDAFGRIDTLVNNAGVSLLGMNDERTRLTEISDDEWDTVLDVNLKGVFLFTRAVMDQMAVQGHGNIVNISSGLGRTAIGGAGPYVASKWGLEGLTRVTALEGDDAGINANGLDPGGRVNTDIWAHLPQDEREQILQPDVMNDAAVLLAAQGPSGVTGESLPADEWEAKLG